MDGSIRQRRGIGPVIGWAAALSAVACGGPADRAAPARELALIEVARIDGGARVGDAGFGRIADIEIGPDGTVYVLDALNREVHAYDTLGTRLHSFGRRGSGPGELEQPNALFLGSDGRLWVVDPGNGRYTLFGGTGALVDTYRSPDVDVLYPLAVGHTAGGSLHTVALEFGRLEQPNAVLVESEAGDGAVRTLRRIDLPSVSWPPPFEHSGGGMMMVLAVPFAPEPAFQIDGAGRLWYASGGEPWVHRLAADGRPEQSYGRDFTAPPVTAAERQAALADGSVDELRAAAGPAGIAELERRIPATKPHLRGFFVDDAGNVWIMRTPASGEAVASPPIELYDADGRPAGIARAPLEAEPRPRARSGLIAGVVRDGLGIESVVVYRIEPGS
jgi:hypothetical protein